MIGRIVVWTMATLLVAKTVPGQQWGVARQLRLRIKQALDDGTSSDRSG